MQVKQIKYIEDYKVVEIEDQRGLKVTISGIDNYVNYSLENIKKAMIKAIDKSERIHAELQRPVECI